MDSGGNLNEGSDLVVEPGSDPYLGSSKKGGPELGFRVVGLSSRPPHIVTLISRDLSPLETLKS